MHERSITSGSPETTIIDISNGTVSITTGFRVIPIICLIVQILSSLLGCHRYPLVVRVLGLQEP